jgi:membrane peptidoglycan carboxypeptidase
MYVASWVDRYGFDPLLQGGLRIYTTLDSSLQAAASARRYARASRTSASA